MRFVAVLALMAAFGVQPAQAFTPEPQGLGAFKALIADDASLGIFEGGNSVFDFGKWAGPSAKTTPKQIYADYNRNEIAADDEFKDKWIVFSGTMSAIRKDAFGNPYIAVDTGSMFHDIQARMDDVPTLGKLSKGETVGLVCRDSSFVLASPVMRHCRLKPDFIAVEARRAAEAALAWLNGGDAPSFMALDDKRNIAFYLYFATSRMQNPALCDPGMHKMEECKKQLFAVDLKKLDFQSAFDAARPDLGLSSKPFTGPTKH